MELEFKVKSFAQISLGFTDRPLIGQEIAALQCFKKKSVHHFDIQILKNPSAIFEVSVKNSALIGCNHSQTTVPEHWSSSFVALPGTSFYAGLLFMISFPIKSGDGILDNQVALV